MNLSYCTGKHAGKPLRTLMAAIACSVAFLPASRVQAETYDFDAEFCLVRREICQEIVDTAKLIQPTYEARSTIWARFLMAGVSWQNRTLNWGNTSDIHLLVRKELPGINVDAEAIAARHQTPEKTIYLLSIRGSDTFVDWVNNVRVRLVDFPYDEGESAGVHRGFLEYA
ncbi:hypothetical protein HC928_07840, partial [bacterium]|nr:hypothetical protein [bacterium]